MTVRTKKDRLGRVIFSVTGVIIASKLLGFLKQMYVSSAFGATLDTDIINLAQSFSGDLEYALTHLLTISFISVYLRIGGGEPRTALFAKNTLRAFLIISLGVSVALIAAAYPLAGLIAPSYDATARGRLAGYFRIYTPLLLLFVITSVCQSLLSANKRFIAVEARSIPQSIIIIAAAALLGKRLGADALAAGFIVCTLFNAVWFFLLSKRYLCPPEQTLPAAPRRFFDCFCDPQVRKLLSLSCPLLMGYSAYYVGQQISKGLASGLGEGAVTELGYGAVLSGLVTAFISSFASIMFSYVTSEVSRGDDRRAARVANLTAALLMAVFLPVTIICGFCSQDIVRIAFGRGEFSDKNVVSTAAALAGYSVSFLPLALQEVYGRVQYGYGDTRCPMINGAVSAICGAVLSLLLSKPLGVGGIALSYSLAALVGGALNLITSRRHNRGLSLKPILPLLPHFAVGGAACFGAVLSCGERLADTSVFPRFLLTAAAGLGIYCAAIAPGVVSFLIPRRSFHLIKDPGRKPMLNDL